MSKRLLLLIIFCLSSAAVPASAQTVPSVDQGTPEQNSDNSDFLVNPVRSDKFTIRVGGFLLSSIKTELNLSNSQGEIGNGIDFSKTLGLNDSLNVLRADAEWRFKPKHNLQFSFFDIKLTSSKTISTEIKWGDVVYPVSAQIETLFRSTVSKISYGYSFYRNAKHDVSATVGVHITRFEAAIGIANTGLTEGYSVTAPLPVFGVEWNAQLTEKFKSKVAFSYFTLSLDDKFSGSLSDFQALLDYQISPRWSLSGGYNRYSLKVDLKGDRDRTLMVKHSYNGFILFLSTHF